MPELRTLGVASHVEGRQYTEDDFKVTAGWGHAGKDGVTMPGKGKVGRNADTHVRNERRLDANERVANEHVEAAANISPEEPAIADKSVRVPSASDADKSVRTPLLDIYLNNHAYWRNVPEPVWNYYIGGYQVIKKWLSYREFSLLGRPLTVDEVSEVTNMIRRIAALILMEAELNENYRRVKADTFAAV